MKFGVCLEMFFTDRPFLDRIKLAANAGFTHAEMWFIDGTFNGKEIDADDRKVAGTVRKVADLAGVTLTSVVIGSPDGSVGGGLTDAARRDEWLKRADAAIAFCETAGIGAAIVCTGNVVKRGKQAEMRKSIVDGLKATADRAEKAGIDLWLEPLNDKIDHPGYSLTSSDAAAEICRDVKSPHLKLLYDCYHMQIMEGDLIGHIQKHFDIIGHMHAAGHPGRHELWLGEVNYPFVVDKIEQMGYEGVFAMEYTPTIDPGESLRMTLGHLEAID
jgi:hydroxypyruvate isomerase